MFPTNWLHRLPITINSADISADLSDWTFVFDNSRFWTGKADDGPLDSDGTRPSLADGGDVRFSTDINGNNEIALDLRNFEPSGSVFFRKIEIAVKIPFVSSSTDTTIYMWRGNATATKPLVTDTYGQYNAYDSNYKAVYPDGGGTDRTSYQNNGSAQGGINEGDSTGKVGKATNYNTVGYFEIPASPSMDLLNNTIEALFKTNTTATTPRWIFEGGVNVIQTGLEINRNSAKVSTIYGISLDYGISGDFDIHYSSNSIAVSTWEHTAITRNGIDNNFTNQIFVDGSLDSTRLGNSPRGSAGISRIGAIVGSTAQRFNGLLGELKISNIVRSNSWVQAGYDNQFNIWFSTFGAIEDVPAPAAGGIGIGLSDIQNISIGTTPVLKVSLGSNLIFG